jgi:hypothetical protein
VSAAQAILTLIGAAVALAGVLGVAYAVLRSRQIETEMQLLRTGIDDRDEALAFERTERQNAEQRSRVEIAELRGQVTALQSEIVGRVVTDVAAETSRAVTRAVTEMADALRRIIIEGEGKTS